LASASMAGSFIHFRSLYKTTAPNIVPYVATTNYNRQERIDRTSVPCTRVIPKVSGIDILAVPAPGRNSWGG